MEWCDDGGGIFLMWLELDWMVVWQCYWKVVVVVVYIGQMFQVVIEGMVFLYEDYDVFDVFDVVCVYLGCDGQGFVD